MLIIWSGNWWALALRAAAAILLGIVAFALPGATLAALVLLFAAYAMLDGILALIVALTFFGGQLGTFFQRPDLKTGLVALLFAALAMGALRYLRRRTVTPLAIDPPTTSGE